MSGWGLYGEPPFLHVCPEGDTRPHDLTAACWCDPAEVDGVTVHNSADGREAIETGERKPS